MDGGFHPDAELDPLAGGEPGQQEGGNPRVPGAQDGAEGAVTAAPRRPLWAPQGRPVGRPRASRPRPHRARLGRMGHGCARGGGLGRLPGPEPLPAQVQTGASTPSPGPAKAWAPPLTAGWRSRAPGGPGPAWRLGRARIARMGPRGRMGTTGWTGGPLGEGCPQPYFCGASRGGDATGRRPRANRPDLPAAAPGCCGPGGGPLIEGAMACPRDRPHGGR